MVSRSLVLLTVLLVGVCNGLTKERLRQALGVQKIKTPSVFRPGVQLLNNPTEADDGMHGEDGGDLFNWTIECPGTYAIFQHMNASGCLDDGTPLSDNFTDESAAQIDMPEFCSSCNATEILDMVVALNASCFIDSDVLRELSMIVPVFAAMCTENVAGELCVADFFLEMWLDDDDDASEMGSRTNESPQDDQRDNSTEEAGRTNNTEPAPAPGPSPSPGAGRTNNTEPAPGPGPGPSPGPSPSTNGPAEGMYWWQGLCAADQCPWEERMLAHQFDCNADLFIMTTLCVRDQERMCVDPVVNFLESGNGYRMPTQYDHEHFCTDPCAGAVIGDMREDGMHIPECMREDDIPIDLSLACFQNNGTYCFPKLYGGMGADHAKLNCTFGDPADIANWGQCDSVCTDSIIDMYAEYGCCADVFMEVEFGYMNVDAVYGWIESECDVPTPPGDLCSEQFEPPRDTPQCRQLRDNDVGVLDALKCLVHLHESF